MFVMQECHRERLVSHQWCVTCSALNVGLDRNAAVPHVSMEHGIDNNDRNFK